MLWLTTHPMRMRVLSERSESKDRSRTLTFLHPYTMAFLHFSNLVVVTGLQLRLGFVYVPALSSEFCE